MQSLHNIRLPDDLALTVRRETVFQTQIVTTGSGFEFRNAGWAHARRHFYLDSGPKPVAEIAALNAFFEARHGRQFGFLLADWLEPHSGQAAAPSKSDQPLLPIDEDLKIFGLQKSYSDGRAPWPVLKPRTNGFVLARDGVELVSGRDYQLNAEQGLVTLEEALPTNASLTAGFWYDVPVRFDVDRLEITRLSADMARVAPIPIIEIPLNRQLD